MNDLLIIFTKYPEPGKAKTRLIEELGADGAAKLSREMTENTIAVARKVCARNGITLEVRYAGGDDASMRAWLGDDVVCMDQSDGDLGQRMEHAFRESLEGGAKRVVIIGTDCPDLDSKTIASAFGELGHHDLVLGPAHDGGYYLIGLSRHLPQLFDGIAWGTDTVFEDTKDIARKSGCSLFLLPLLHDVDRPEDLEPSFVVRRSSFEKSKTRPTISVIIPTLNEEGDIARAVESATVSGSTEIIVVDGGSTDRTVKIASDLGAHVIEHAPGRAGQLNAGARAARGDFLVFLHADSQLPRGYELEVVETLEQLDVACGAFTLRFEGRALALRLLEFTANIRSRLFKLPYGDQALFVTAATFHDLGGFPDLPLMDDFQFVRNAKKRGSVVTLSEQVITSSRRYEKKGPIRTALLNQAIIIGYYLGVSPKRLASWYGQKR